jgi:hypothetical protein
VTWAIIHGDASWADLNRLTSEDRSAIDDLLSAWVTSEPPRERSRNPSGVILFEHHLESEITYFVDDQQHLVGILRIR